MKRASGTDAGHSAPAAWNIAFDTPMVGVDSWGRALRSNGRVLYATETNSLRRIFEQARRAKKNIAIRGAGNSYSDAFQNDGGIVVDTSGMNSIISIDRETGIVHAGPGLSIAQLWRSTLSEGFWPPVVTGTMFATFGGLAAMNAHGKNNFKRGTFGDNIVEFTIMLPDGSELTCSRSENPGLFHAAIGGFGVLGCFTSMKLQMKRVESGLLEVDVHVTKNLTEAFQCFDRNEGRMDYFVGWFDGFARGGSLGRGVIHTARYLHADEVDDPAASLDPASQELPDRILGFPKSLTWMLLRPFVNDFGMRYINLAKYLTSRVHPDGHSYRQPLAAFSFLLDYVPNWKYSYGPGGLIQYQSFIPKEHACRVYEQLIALSQERGLPPYLLVFKRHRPDPFLLTHAVDGWSLAMDYRVTEKNRRRLWDLAHEMDSIVHAVGGRFYFAKDATLRPESLRRIWPAETIAQFLELKRRYDPEFFFQTDLFRRVFKDYL